MISTTPPLMSPPLGAPGSTPPTAPTSRNIIILLDGTGNQFSAQNSNVIKLMSVLRVDDQQLVYYSSGLGTILPDGFASYEALKAGAAKLSDEVLALNFDHFVQDAYQYLMDYYHAGDKIYLFGFSRGAYTARALAGMIQQVGLLPPGNHNQIKLAYEVYANPGKYKSEFDKLHKITTLDKDGKKQELSRDPGMLYRRIFGVSRTVDIEFLGVWDTVSSLGGFSLPELPFAAGVSSVKIFRQALALDERRARFEPEYRQNDYQVQDLLDGVARAQVRLLKAKQAKADAATLDSAAAHLNRWKTALNVVYPEMVKVKGVDRYKSREVWFMGCHSDVGGGNANNDVPALSNIPFRWMLREAVRFDLQLDPSGFALCDALVKGSTLDDPKLSTTTVAAVKALRAILDDQERLAAEETQAREDRDRKAGGYWGHGIWEALTGKATKGVEGEDEPPVMDEKRIRKSTKACEADNREQIYALWSVLKQEELAKIVEIAAGIDTMPVVSDSGKPVPPNKDVLSKLHESLTAAWKVVEYIPLVLRGHTVSGKEEDAINEGRQMIPHQKLHKSILRRLEYERLAKADDAYIPAAAVPEAWPTWQQLKADGKTLPDEFLEE